MSGSNTDPGPAATDPTIILGHNGTLDLSSIVGELATPGLSGDTLTLDAATATNGSILTEGGDLLYEPIAGATVSSGSGYPLFVGYSIATASGTS